MLERFDEFKKDRREKEKVIEYLQEKVSVLSNKVEKIENNSVKQAQDLSKTVCSSTTLRKMMAKIQIK